MIIEFLFLWEGIFYSPKIYFPHKERLEWKDWTHRCSSFGYLKLYYTIELWRIPSKPLFSQCGKGLDNFPCDEFLQEIYIHGWHVWKRSTPHRFEMLGWCIYEYRIHSTMALQQISFFSILSYEWKLWDVWNSSNLINARFETMDPNFHTGRAPYRNNGHVKCTLSNHRR